jgi:hypothetical protein
MRSPIRAWWLVIPVLLLAGCAAKDYPARDDHDHTPGPPLPAMSSMPEGG